MDIIFLDVDGVLNNTKNEFLNKDRLDKNCILNLKKLLDNTNIKIVLSSTWRFQEKKKYKLFEKMNELGIDVENRVIGETDNLKSIRQNEILKWVTDNNNKINRWVALDDFVLRIDPPNYHQINNYNGLTNNDIKIIKEYFNKQK